MSAGVAEAALAFLHINVVNTVTKFYVQPPFQIIVYLV